MKSRLPGFYKMTIDERLALIRERELINEDEWQMLRGRTGPQQYPSR